MTLQFRVRFAAILSLVSALAIIGALAFATTETTRVRAHQKLAHELNRTAQQLNTLSSEFLLHKTPRVIRQFEARQAAFDETLEKIGHSEPLVARLVHELADRNRIMESLFGRLTKLQAVDSMTAVTRREAERTLQIHLLLETESMSSLSQEIAQIRDARVNYVTRLGLFIVIGCGLMLIVVNVFTYLLFSRGVMKPLFGLRKTARAIGQGDLDQPIDTRSPDELGDLARDLDQMRKRLRTTIRDLERSNQELDQFAYVASHDLRAPLRGIANLADWISDDLGQALTGEAAKYMSMLKGRVTRLDALLNDLLALSRAGHTEDHIVPIDTAHLSREIFDDVAPPGFRLWAHGALPVVYGHVSQWRIILGNLISNAIKHHDREDGCIEIAAEERDAFWRFVVTDDGPGIPAECRERIFELFQTLRPRDEVEGSGLGLAIVRKTIDKYGGTILATECEAERGTRFIFTMPQHITSETHRD